jgi:hypothetical protein
LIKDLYRPWGAFLSGTALKENRLELEVSM